jgi:hypothetical protein
MDGHYLIMSFQIPHMFPEIRDRYFCDGDKKQTKEDLHTDVSVKRRKKDGNYRHDL